jgi:hypothetical protein
MSWPFVLPMSWHRTGASPHQDSPLASSSAPFELKAPRKTRTLLRIASDTLATEDALERDHLRSAIGGRRDRHLYGLRRVQGAAVLTAVAPSRGGGGCFGLSA